MCNIDKFTYNDAIITVIRSIGVVENLLQKKREVKFYIIFFSFGCPSGYCSATTTTPSCDHNKQPTKRCHGIVSRSYFYYLPKLEAPWDLNYTNTKK